MELRTSIRTRTLNSPEIRRKRLSSKNKSRKRRRVVAAEIKIIHSWATLCPTRIIWCSLSYSFRKFIILSVDICGVTLTSVDFSMILVIDLWWEYTSSAGLSYTVIREYCCGGLASLPRWSSRLGFSAFTRTARVRFPDGEIFFEKLTYTMIIIQLLNWLLSTATATLTLRFFVLLFRSTVWLASEFYVWVGVEFLHSVGSDSPTSFQLFNWLIFIQSLLTLINFYKQLKA